MSSIERGTFWITLAIKIILLAYEHPPLFVKCDPLWLRFQASITNILFSLLNTASDNKTSSLHGLNLFPQVCFFLTLHIVFPFS